MPITNSTSTLINNYNYATTTIGTDFHLNTDTISINPYNTISIDKDSILKWVTQPTKVQKPLEFENIKEYVKDKVYEFTFTDGTKIKTVCDKNDHFDLEYAFYLAIAKKLYSKEYTLTGVSWKASEMYFEKKYIKIVKKGMKLFKKLQEEEQKKKDYDETKKRQHERYVRHKKAVKERKRKDQINIIAEAIRLSKEGE